MLRKCVVYSLVLAFVMTAAMAPLSMQSKSNQPQMIDQFLFFPSKYPEGNWEPPGLRFEELSFTAADGTRLHAWYCPCEQPRAMILLAHGNAGNLATRVEWLTALQSQAQASVLIFDYRGYGKSEGKPSVEGALQDARAARAKLAELASIDDSQMLLMGESLGGAIVSQLAAESAPRGLILQSTFSSLRDVADVHYPQLSWLVARNRLNSATQLAQVHVPLFQSHGVEDRTIPYGLGKKLFEAANEPKTLFSIAAADHNDWQSSSYLRKLNAFIDSLPSEPPR